MTTKRNANCQVLVPGTRLEHRYILLITLGNTGLGEVYFWVLPFIMLLVIGLIWYYKEQGLKRRAKQMRKQIAEDFHDELGSKLTIYSTLLK